MRSLHGLILSGAVILVIAAVMIVSAGCEGGIAPFTGGSDQLSPTELEMLEMINTHRASIGLGALATDPLLNRIAQDQADNQAEDQNVEHAGDNDEFVNTRANQVNYNYSSIAENVGSASGVGEMFDDWLEDPEARAVIESTVYTEIGLGVAYVLNQHYWTTVLARPQ